MSAEAGGSGPGVGGTWTSRGWVGANAADDRHADLMARLAALAPTDSALEQICRGSVSLLEVSGAAVILMSREDSGTRAAAFGAGVEAVEDLQFALGEGPCQHAFLEGTPVLEPDLLDGRRVRWPIFAEQAVALGARSIFVLPLQLGAIRLGVLYLYRDRPGMLSPQQLADALDLAELAMLAVLERQTHATAGALGAGLEGDWTHRAAVHQATGVVSVQLDLGLADALALLRARAFAEARSIYDVATEVVAGGIRLER